MENAKLYSNKDKCDNYFISRRQRDTDGLLSSIDFQYQGCYNCEGLDFECEYYSNKLNSELCRIAKKNGK